ncbi:MAG: hypothetical protein ACYTG0_08805 [Planctomycetota bacterium]
MRTAVLSVHPGLADSSRLPGVPQEGQRLEPVEILVLVSAGVVAAAASAFLDFSLRIPGHAIIRVVFPMAFGLAVAPRRMAGMVMGASALGSALLIRSSGLAAIGVGAITSVTLAGPMLDLALWRARQGWRLYVGFALAGLCANMAAFTVRGGIKLAGLDHAGGRPLALWWPQAIGTYALYGALAGLVSALVWFQFAARDRGGSAGENSE